MEQLGYVGKANIDGLLKNHYHEEAEMVTFDFILKEKKQIKKYLKEDLLIETGQVLDLDYFVATDDTINNL